MQLIYNTFLTVVSGYLYTPPTLNIHVPGMPTLVVRAMLIMLEVRDPEMV